MKKKTFIGKYAYIEYSEYLSKNNLHQEIGICTSINVYLFYFEISTIIILFQFFNYYIKDYAIFTSIK